MTVCACEKSAGTDGRAPATSERRAGSCVTAAPPRRVWYGRKETMSNWAQADLASPVQRDALAVDIQRDV
jgi:hypothetical protein